MTITTEKSGFKWHRRFMGLANHISEWTEDRDFKVGAVIVGTNHEIRSTGYNGLPRQIKAIEESRFDRKSGEKFFWFEHAERNAIYNAAYFGATLSGCTLYVNRFPCADCARAIIQSGITTVCCPAKPEKDGALDHSFDVSEILLQEAGVQRIEWE
ncbi:deoxycytidylate deaminase [Sneathiella aquimaris]|uniref:deoxycytidylate deaminase n=1 Tax=Sneathiella aquimaris TaxID=2599305 RepID=UPI00146C0C3D|nr:deaminase [Sneathiella aquimaris]